MKNWKDGIGRLILFLKKHSPFSHQDQIDEIKMNILPIHIYSVVGAKPTQAKKIDAWFLRNKTKNDETGRMECKRNRQKLNRKKRLSQRKKKSICCMHHQRKTH